MKTLEKKRLYHPKNQCIWMKMAENDEMIFGNRNDEVGEKMRTELMKSIMKRRITR